MEPTIFIIDEASMIASLPKSNPDEVFNSKYSMLQDIITFCKAVHPDSKIIFLGDRFQLTPINEKVSFALDAKYLTTTFNIQGKEITLTEVMRQKAESRIMQNAIGTRIAIEQGKTSYNLDADVALKNIYKGVDAYVKAFKTDELDTNIAIGCTHASNKFFNDLVRKQLYSNPRRLEKGDYLLVTKTHERNGHKLYSGDHVTLISFDENAIETIAGIQFMPIEIRPTHAKSEDATITDLLRLDLIDKPQGTNVLTTENKLRHERMRVNKVFRETGNPKDDKYIGALRLSYGHAITCNKAQGGEWKNVYLNMNKVPTLNWLYTGITRAQDRLITY